MGDDCFQVTLWVHGTAGNVVQACGEVDVICFTGHEVSIDCIEQVMKDAEDFEAWLHKLPTEDWLDVKLKRFNDEYGFYFEVLSFEANTLI